MTTDEILLEEVMKLGSNDIYWDYNDELSKDQIDSILNGCDEMLMKVELEILSENFVALDEQKDILIDRALEEVAKKIEVTPEIEARFKELIEENDKLLDDANLPGLASKTYADFIVVVNEPELSYQSWRGVETKEQVDEIAELCKLLNCDPTPLQALIDNDNRPSYAPDPLFMPQHPERAGNEYATTQMVDECLREATYGGRLVFMCRMQVSDLLEHPGKFKAGPIRIHKGTQALIYDFGNGAGSCADIVLQKDLVLPAASYDFDLDINWRYGIQSCYGFDDTPWKAGHITTESNE